MWTCPNCKRTFKNRNQAHYCGEKPATIDAYIAAQPEEIQPILHAVRDTIRAALPEAEERMSWSMPTYWKGHNLIHFAANKHHLGLYPGEEAAAAFAERLAGYRVSKGTIQLPYAQPMPLPLIAEIAAWCWQAEFEQPPRAE